VWKLLKDCGGINRMGTFKIAINMAGAISAGAYTAGVLDFLIEALDAWYEAKSTNQAVPRHDVSIDVFSGASAGGMCAAISAMLLRDDFDHISNTTETGTTNRFYEAWVNMIDIRKLLQSKDLESKGPVVSLLDSTIIDSIAEYALTPGKRLAKRRPYVSPDLTLFLSLTNLRGVVYSLNGFAPGSIEETTFFYGDRIRFQMVSEESKKPLADAAYPINLSTGNGDLSLLGMAAKATGAFPVFLAPRTLLRRKSDYTPPLWESCMAAANDVPPPIRPSFPGDLPEPFETLNVDGGVTNNDPFIYAHDYLASLDPPAQNQILETDPCRADRAVLSIAPFPTTETFTATYDTRKNSSVLRALPRLFSALIAQSRFFGESLSHLMRGTTFSHFVIAPSDDELVKKYEEQVPAKPVPEALQCATLGAFGGFFERGFRAHDYALGRRNCQKFLLDHFVLPADNVMMKEALGELSEDLRAQIMEDFRRECPKGPGGEPLTFPPGSCINAKTVWLPVVPLCSEALRQPILAPDRARMKDSDLVHVIDLVSKRFRAVTSVLISSIRHWQLRLFLKPGPWFIAFFGRGLVKQALIQELGDSYEPN
jgi:hypothetical protein